MSKGLRIARAATPLIKKTDTIITWKFYLKI